MKIHLYMGLSGAVIFMVSLLLLQIEYPWADYASFDYGKGITLMSYLSAAAIVAVVAATFTGLCLNACRRSILWSGILCCLLTSIVLSLIAFLLGPGGLDIPGTRVNGIFFSEFKFLNFIFIVALPASIVAAALCVCLARRSSCSKTLSEN